MDKKKLLESLKQSKEKLSKEKNVERIILFGSRARGRFKKDSDVDLMIVSSQFKGMKYGRAIGLRKYFNLDLPMDFLCYTPAEFSKKSKRITIAREALKHGIEV